MGKQYLTRTFKSGNSVALRLPASLGVEPGLEMLVREERGGFVVEPAPRVSGSAWDMLKEFWGTVPDFGKHMPEGRGFDDPGRGPGLGGSYED